MSLPALLLLLASDTTVIDSASATTVTFGGFADVYYAWDAGRPAQFDRVFTTQPARHNEFNANLAYLEAVVSGARLRGRFALQAGTSVQANYVTEPQIGTVSGGQLSRTIQEAVIGYRIAPGLWVDGGIYFSYLGNESWISRDDLTYTRSLIADYTPYYLSGVKLSWDVTPTFGAQLHVVNGWQNVSENNAQKSVGLRLDWKPSPALAVGYDTFLGNEQPDSLPGRTRFYQEFLATWSAGRGWTVAFTLDLGLQSSPTGPQDTWYGWSAIARKAVTPRVRVVGRFERFVDRTGVIVRTGTPNGFETSSASLGLDVQLDRRALWRTEIRGYDSSDQLWPRAGLAGAARRDGVAVTSLAVSF